MFGRAVEEINQTESTIIQPLPKIGLGSFVTSRGWPDGIIVDQIEIRELN